MFYLNRDGLEAGQHLIDDEYRGVELLGWQDITVQCLVNHINSLAAFNPIPDGFPISRWSSLSISKRLAHKFYYSIHNAYRYSTLNG